MHAIVGANNAGKSTILRAMDFLLNPSTTKISDESFYNRDLTSEIRVEAVFGSLTDAETEALKAYTAPDGIFRFCRTASVGVGAGEDDGAESTGSDGKVTIGQEYCKPQPKHEWLKASNVKAATIKEWQASGDMLVANGHSFLALVGAKPTVETWKLKAEEFARTYLKAEDFEDVWEKNPKRFCERFESGPAALRVDSRSPGRQR